VLVESLVQLTAVTNASTVTDPTPGAPSANQPRLSGSGDSPRGGPRGTGRAFPADDTSDVPTRNQPVTDRLLAANPCSPLLLDRPQTSTRTR
jgi:hypothetical protein